MGAVALAAVLRPLVELELLDDALDDDTHWNSVLCTSFFVAVFAPMVVLLADAAAVADNDAEAVAGAGAGVYGATAGDFPLPLPLPPR